MQHWQALKNVRWSMKFELIQFSLSETALSGVVADNVITKNVTDNTCSSTEREKCFEYKESFRFFYK